MIKLKRLVATILTIIMVASTWGGSITATAKETASKVYGPQNIETARLTKKDIPDALIENGDFAEIIQDNYVKRLYNEENDMNTLMFEKANGERAMYLFKKAVKYEDENGNIVDKDLGFKEYNDKYKCTFGDAYVCDNGNNDIKIYMPEDISNGVKLVTDDKTIEMRAKGVEVTDKVTVNDDSVVYDEVFGENTSLIYKPLLDGIKEEIVLDEYTGQTEYKFRIKLDGYKLVTLDDNCLYLENVDNGEIEGIIDSVYMIDANGVTDFNNYYTYKRVGKYEYEITAHVNKVFLEAETTVYPVVIDPTITIQKSNSSAGIYDATLNSTSTTEGGSGSLFVGNRSNTENGISRVAMRFPGLNFTTLKVSVVKSASVYLRDLICESSALTISCHQIANGSAAWNESNVNWNLLAMGATGTNSAVGDLLSSQTVSYSNGLNQTTAHTYKFDITDAVFDWRAGNSLAMARGIVFKASSESSVIHKTFGSYNRASYNPVFEMSYIPYEGGYAYSHYSTLEKNVSSGIYTPNCLGLAFNNGAIVDILDIGCMPTNVYDVTELADLLAEYVETNGEQALGYNHARVVNNVATNQGLFENVAGNTADDNDEHLIALRVYIGEGKLVFHVIVQMNDGRWIHKPGGDKMEVLGYIDPDIEEQACWDRGNGTHYNSDTVYIVMRKGTRN